MKPPNKDKPHFHDHRKRLRDRFQKKGIDSLQPYEIIELFLTFVIPQKDVKPMAKEAIMKFKTIQGFFDADEVELSKLPYFKDKACTLVKFIKEISLLYQKQKIEDAPISQARHELIEYCSRKIGFSQNEEFWVIPLDSKLALIKDKEELISKGLIIMPPKNWSEI
ncbi:MAG TPA: hypothetical protein PK581_08910 [Caldisericia bacterium]|nr:hypothetical protein [Caldisericia bacterium]